MTDNSLDEEIYKLLANEDLRMTVSDDGTVLIGNTTKFDSQRPAKNGYFWTNNHGVLGTVAIWQEQLKAEQGEFGDSFGDAPYRPKTFSNALVYSIVSGPTASYGGAMGYGGISSSYGSMETPATIDGIYSTAGHWRPTSSAPSPKLRMKSM